MKKRVLITIMTLYLLAGCAGRNEPVRLAEVPVEPVTTPQVYRYGPAEGTLSGTTVLTTPEVRNTQVLDLRYTILREQDRLVWHAWVPEWVENGKRFAPNVPLLDMVFDSDLRGVTDDIEISFPLVKAVGITSPALLMEFDKLAKSVAEAYQPLPEKGIVTGDQINRMNFPHWRRVFEGTPPMLPIFLEGELTHDDIRYVVVGMRKSLNGNLRESGAAVFIDVEYRAVMRKENMESVYEMYRITATSPLQQRLLTIDAEYELKK